MCGVVDGVNGRLNKRQGPCVHLPSLFPSDVALAGCNTRWGYLRAYDNSSGDRIGVPDVSSDVTGAPLSMGSQVDGQLTFDRSLCHPYPVMHDAS